MIGRITTLKRRGVLATLLVFGLTLGIGLGIVLAAGMSATPSQGRRDDGDGNQTPINVSGDLTDSTTQAFLAPEAYWDAANESNPTAAYQIAIIGSPTVATGGTFDFDVELPLYDHNSEPVRPGAHRVTICAPRTPAAARVVDCRSDDFRVLKGTATLSTTSGRPYDDVTVSGSRWVPGTVVPDEEVWMTWDPAGDARNLTFDFFPGSSTWSTTFSVPRVDPGTYNIRICNVPYHDIGPDVCSPADTLIKSFTIVPPDINLNKNSGESGASVKVSGSGFFPSTSLYLFIGPKGANPSNSSWVEILPGTAKASDRFGDFGPYTFTASGAAGDYDVLACGIPLTLVPSDVCDTAATGRAPYEIVAAATPTPTVSPTPEPTASPTPTPSPTPTATPTASPTPTQSPTFAPTEPPTPTPSAVVTTTPSPAPTTEPTAPPTPTAAPSPSPVAPVSWPQHLGGPDTVFSRLDLGTIGGISLLALLIAFLVPFPGTLFNKTVEANYEEIRGWMAGGRRRWNALLDKLAVGPLGAVRRRLGSALTGRFGVVIFLATSALVYGFLSPTFGLDLDSLALFLGLLVGLLFIVAAFDLPLRIYHGRRTRGRDAGVLRALWWTLLVALVCVVVSRLAGFQPGYLYGLIISIVFVTDISTREEGVGTWLASVWLLALSFIGWVVLALVRQQIGDPWMSLFLQTVLVTFVVAGIETLAIGLLPMRFLPGHPLYSWRGIMWFPLFALAIFAYLLILVDPANGYLSNDSITPMLVGVIFLATFGIVSIGTWAYFRFRPARVDGDRPGEVAAE